MAKARTLLPVAVDTLFAPATFDFDLYIRPDPSGPALLYREHSFPFERGDVDRLMRRGVTTLYIPDTGAASYQRYVHQEILSNTSLPPGQRFEALTAAGRMTFYEAFADGQVDRMIAFAEDLAGRVVDILCQREMVLFDLFRVMRHDHHTYTHVSNVCGYCLALAERAGVSDRDELASIGAGALLHDIGKRHVPRSLLNKPGRLTDPEREVIQRHPSVGFEELSPRQDLSWGQLMMVYQHHERLNGRGYPVRLQADEIHPWARLCAVVDVFDALTCQRPYRRPWPVKEAMAYLHERAGSEFDKEMVQCWMAAMNSAR